jgi:Flp pilus assembly protein TadG
MERRVAGSWPARPAGFAQGLFRHQAGIAIAEFAIMLPVLMTLFYGCIEVTRYILVVQKTEKLANTVADVVAQSSKVTTASLDQVLAATGDIMQPFSFSANGRVIITSLYRDQDAAGAIVNWRYTGGGSLTADSQLGDLNTTPVLPTGFAFDKRENVIAAEVYFRFSPLISNQFFGTTTVYRQAFYKPRFGLLTTAPS